jgi:dephospho-CoA kinase
MACVPLLLRGTLRDGFCHPLERFDDLKRPQVVGLIGGIASGKSCVAKLLVEHGACVISADAIGHQILLEPVVRDELLLLFGPSIFDAQGNIDRSAIAKLVFGNDDQSKSRRKELEAILHPRIRVQAQKQIDGIINESNKPMIVLDAPLLIEAGWQSFCDAIVFVDTPMVRRIDFARQRGWSPEELSRREANQLPLDEKRSYASFIISNSGSIDDLKRQVEAFVQSIAG